MATQSWCTNVSEADLAAARDQYLRLPENSRQPSPTALSYHLHNLADVIRSYGLTNLFGLHLLHRHFKLPLGTVVFGEHHTAPISAWVAKPTPYENIDKHNIRPHNLAVIDGVVRPYEFRTGRWDGSTIDPAFWADVADYIMSHELQNVLGLQILQGQSAWECELVFLNCTVMLPGKVDSSRSFGLITGWVAAHDGTGLTINEIHVMNEDGKHQPINAGALNSIWDIPKSLLQMDLTPDPTGAATGTFVQMT